MYARGWFQDLPPETGKVLEPKGVRHKYLVATSDKTQITTLAYMQPMILFPGKCIRWITAQVFKQFLDLLNTLYFLIFNNTSSLYSLMDIVYLKSSDNYIPEKRKFSGILCFRQQRSRRRRVTILTHALFIQISSISSIIDTVAPFKMAAGGHVVKNLKKSSVSI